MTTDLERAAGRVVRAWANHATETSYAAMIKAETKASWPDLYAALEALTDAVTNAILDGRSL